MKTSERWQTLTSAFWVALLPGAALFAWLQLRGYAGAGMLGADSHAYWLAARDPSSWYTRAPGTWDAYLYSPVFAQVLWPLGRLPWQAFQVVWLGAQLGLVAWLLKPMGWRKTLVLTAFLAGELALGNIYLFLAAALVLAVTRSSGALVLPGLTKVAPAVVGLWFVLRGQWRAAGLALATTASITAVSVLLAPQAWVRWLDFLRTSADSSQGVSTMVRLALAALLVTVAARTDRSWLLAPALVLACPVLGGWNYLAGLAALPRLLTRDRASRHEHSLTSARGERGRVNAADEPGLAPGSVSVAA